MCYYIKNTLEVDYMDDKILKALFEPKRFLLIKLMAERSYCVRALARKSYLSEPAVSQHLKVLSEAGLVFGIKKGYYTHYGLNKETLGAVIDEFIAIRDAKRLPCDGPNRGCPESEYLRCRENIKQKKQEKIV